MIGWKCGTTRRTIDVVIGTSQASQVNIFALAGSPTDIVDVVIWNGYSLPSNNATVAGVNCQAGMTLGSGWANGCSFTLKNAGGILGLGGGASGSEGQGGSGSFGGAQAGFDGHAGLDALVLTAPITIENANGAILGRGGQGGGGGGSSGLPKGAGGGGGGGGRGFNNAAGGNGGASTSGGWPGNSGNPGSSAGPGTGGTPSGGPPSAGSGGDGGDWGAAGASGAGSDTGQSGGAGGAAGKAIKTNGFAVTWLSGNDAAHVKGAVAP